MSRAAPGHDITERGNMGGESRPPSAPVPPPRRRGRIRQSCHGLEEQGVRHAVGGPRNVDEIGRAPRDAQRGMNISRMFDLDAAVADAERWRSCASAS